MRTIYAEYNINHDMMMTCLRICEGLRLRGLSLLDWRIKKIGSCSKGGLQWGFGFLC